MLKRIAIGGVVLLAIGFLVWGLFVVKSARQENKTVYHFVPNEFDYVIHIPSFENLNRSMVRWGMERRAEDNESIAKISPWVVRMKAIFEHKDNPIEFKNSLIVKKSGDYIGVFKSLRPNYNTSNLLNFLQKIDAKNTVSEKEDYVVCDWNGTKVFGKVDHGVILLASSLDLINVENKVSESDRQELEVFLTQKSNDNAAINVLLSDNISLQSGFYDRKGWAVYDVYFKNNGVHSSGIIQGQNTSFSNAEHDVFQFTPIGADEVYSYTFDRKMIKSVFEGLSREYYSWIGVEASVIKKGKVKLLSFTSANEIDIHFAMEEVNLNASEMNQTDSLKNEAHSNYTIYKNYAADIFSEKFKKLDSNLNVYPAWYIFVNNKIFFSDEAASLKEYIDLYAKGDILSEQPNFSKMLNHYKVKRTSMSSYAANSIEFGNDPVLEAITYGQCYFSLTYLNENEMIGNVFAQQQANSIQSKSSSKDTLWQLELIGIKNVIASGWLKNHRDGTYNLLLQDQSKVLYSITEKGVLQWKIPLKQKITSPFQKIDLYQNGKNQILFSTTSQIHIVDVLGRNVNQFPFQCHANVSSLPSVIDYDNDGNYRIFAGLQNGGVVNIDKEGKAVEGWAYESAGNAIKSAVYFSSYAGYDYLHFVDDKGRFYATGRRGEDRLKNKIFFSNFEPQGLQFEKGKNWETSKYRYVSKNGIIKFGYVNGAQDSIPMENTKAIKVWDFGLEKDNDNQYWLATTPGKISVYTKVGLKVFDFATDVTAIKSLKYVKLTEQNCFAFLDGSNKKVYLLDKHGEIIEGYPKSGEKGLWVLDKQKRKQPLYFVFKNEHLVCLPFEK